MAGLTKHSCVKRIQICLNEVLRPILKDENHEILKRQWQRLNPLSVSLLQLWNGIIKIEILINIILYHSSGSGDDRVET